MSASVPRLRKDGRPYARCGHDPRNPRLELRNPPHASMPSPIRDMCKAAQSFYFDASRIPSLNKRLKEEARDRRSERREALALTLQELAMHTDVATWRVGNYGGDLVGRQPGRAVGSYARNEGIHRRRVERSLHDTIEAGFFLFAFEGRRRPRAVPIVTDYAGRQYYGQRRLKKIRPDGAIEYEAMAAEREWTAKALNELGVLDEFKAARKEARAAARKEAEDSARAANIAAQQQASQQASEFRRASRIKTAPRPTPAADEAEVKATHQLAAHIFKEAGGALSLRDAMTEATRRRGTGPPE